MRVNYFQFNANMQNDYFVNLVQADWPDRNLLILKHCKEEAYKAVSAHIADYPPTRHLPVVKGVLAWDRLDYFLDAAARKGLFEGITSHWIEFMGAPILELRGKYSSLTAKHVLNRDDRPNDSETGYRNNNRAKNQKNLELFKEFEDLDSKSDLIHVVLKHGGRNDNFAFLQVYLEDSDIPAITTNIMLMESQDMAPEMEHVLKPSVTLKDKAILAEPELRPTLSVLKTENEYSES